MSLHRITFGSPVNVLLSALTNKLMVRVTNYFDTQIRIPIPPEKVKHLESTGSGVGGVLTPNSASTSSAFQSHLREGSGLSVGKEMSAEQLTSWYGKILEGVKQRYRKLQRLARSVVILSSICDAS